MPRDLPIGNERLLILFDEDYRLRDLYYPNVGKENHAGGYPFRFGVFADGEFPWIGAEPGWGIGRRYQPHTPGTRVRCSNLQLGVELEATDPVDFHKTGFLRP